MNNAVRITLLLLAIIALPHPSKGRYRRYGSVLMYYDLCPWQYCGCPFCVEKPPIATTTPLTTSTLIRQVETTTEAVTETEETTTPEPTTETTAADTEFITTTTEMSPTETETTETVQPETEEPLTEPTTSRPRATTASTSGTTSPVCTLCIPICNTWPERINRWIRPPPSPPRIHLRYTSGRGGSCRFCGQSWISGSFGRKIELQRQYSSSRRNRWNGWSKYRWGRKGGSGNPFFGQHLNQVEVFPPQRTFNQLRFSNSFLFG